MDYIIISELQAELRMAERFLAALESGGDSVYLTRRDAIETGERLVKAKLRVIEIEARLCEVQRQLSIDKSLEAASVFVATREKMKSIAAGTTETVSHSWFSQLKWRNSNRIEKDHYYCFTGSRDHCLEGCKHWPGSRMRKNGENGNYLLIVPSTVITSNQSIAIAA
jgi:hypothetical protein